MPPADPTGLDLLYDRLKRRDVDDSEHQARRVAFIKRGPSVEDYLLEKLAQETDPALQGDVLQILGKLRFHGGKRLTQTAEWARRLLRSEVDLVRCRALWVLGWLGGPDDLVLLSGALQSDTNAENRGWAATAMMQIFMADPTNAGRWLVPLQQALRREKDEFALEKILISVQEISGKRLGLKSSSRERAPKAKLDAALRKALALKASPVS
jgi:hypothetical protein